MAKCLECGIIVDNDKMEQFIMENGVKVKIEEKFCSQRCLREYGKHNKFTQKFSLTDIIEAFAHEYPKTFFIILGVIGLIIYLMSR
jgi:hypothetical protein